MKTVAHNTQELGNDLQIERFVAATSRYAGIALFVMALIAIAYLIVISAS